MNRDQKIVALDASSGVITMILSILVIYHHWPQNLALADMTNRLAYTLQADAFAVLPLLVSIMAVGNNRFLSEAIDPTLHKENLHTQINARVVEKHASAIRPLLNCNAGALPPSNC